MRLRPHVLADGRRPRRPSFVGHLAIRDGAATSGPLRAERNKAGSTRTSSVVVRSAPAASIAAIASACRLDRDSRNVRDRRRRAATCAPSTTSAARSRHQPASQQIQGSALAPFMGAAVGAGCARPEPAWWPSESAPPSPAVPRRQCLDQARAVRSHASRIGVARATGACAPVVVDDMQRPAPRGVGHGDLRYCARHGDAWLPSTDGRATTDRRALLAGRQPAGLRRRALVERQDQRRRRRHDTDRAFERRDLWCRAAAAPLAWPSQVASGLDHRNAVDRAGARRSSPAVPLRRDHRVISRGAPTIASTGARRQAQRAADAAVLVMSRDAR